MRKATRDPRPSADDEDDVSALEGERRERLVVTRRALGAGGRLRGVLAASALVALIGLGLGLARLEDRGAPVIRLSRGASAAGTDDVRSPISPLPAPAVTPASSCTAIGADRPPDAELVVGEAPGVIAVPVYDRWAGTSPPIDASRPIPSLAVPSGHAIELAVVGDVCARAWDIVLTTGDAMGVRSIVERQTNPAMDPRVAAQNRFTFRLTGGGAIWDIAATLVFPGGAVDYRWRAVLAGSPSARSPRPASAILPSPAWGYSSAGRASEWHSEGQGFETP